MNQHLNYNEILFNVSYNISMSDWQISLWFSYIEIKYFLFIQKTLKKPLAISGCWITLNDDFNKLYIHMKHIPFSWHTNLYVFF